jgi:L-ascorbate metabolism protein UlaG (beta-lactamase superfamily)
VKILLVILTIIIVVYGCVYINRPALADPIVVSQVNSDHYENGFFKNPIERPLITSTESRASRLYRFVFGKDKDSIPAQPIPSQKTDLMNLDPSENTIVWMGHSSYFMQLEGSTFLIDPVFSTNASPVPMTNTAFEGSNIYTAEDIPEIDYLLITHDHWDHLDFPTIDALKDKIHEVITPLGVGSYFEQWGFDSDMIHEGDWFSSFEQQNLAIHIMPAQHFSGRLLERNRTLWGSFAIITKQHKIYFGGDSGYGPHFKQIAEELGNFDVAILEDGQYNDDWPYIHMTPEETVQAAKGLGTKAVLPSHNSKFKLSHHTWYEPLERVYQASQNQPFKLMTPLIGQQVNIDEPGQEFKAWWREYM